MNVSLTIQSAAGEDIRELIAWYDEQQPGLGRRFLASLDQTIETIAKSPGIFQIRYKEVRMAPMATFPVSVHYQFFREQKAVVVLAVLHQSRNPDRWRGR